MLLRLVLGHDSAEALRLAARELGSVGISFAPGTSGLLGGRPRPRPHMTLRSCLIPKKEMPAPVVTHQGTSIEVRISTGGETHALSPLAPASEAPPQSAAEGAPADTCPLPLSTLAHTRSGDKGDDVNIAVIARRPEFVEVLREQLTPETIARHFSHAQPSRVRRFEVPGLDAFNYLLHDCLAGADWSHPESIRKARHSARWHWISR